jgi:peptidoglycan/LPS O-acetylase OafA/YrhL
MFHLFGDGRVSGGVDVFLLLSGFLTTRSLLSRASAGTLRLGEYYGRVFTRLIPASLFVLFVTAVIIVAIVPGFLWEQSAREIAAAIVYWLNWELIESQLAYGAAGPQTSPVQHFWSMSVQGQFFLLWPLVVMGAFTGARNPWRRRSIPGHRPVRILAILVVVATAASFAYATYLGTVNQPRAYFDTLARFWELGAGALFALVWPHLRVPDRWRAPLGWAGVTLLVGCGFVLDGARLFPGPWALLPVTAALAVLAGSGTTSVWSPNRLLESRPLRFIGDISYALYLWHWPLLFAWLYVTRNTTVGVGGAVVVLSISTTLAWLTHRFISTPVQRSWTRRKAVTSAAAAGAAVALAGVMLLAASALERHERALEEQAASAAREATCLGAAALDPMRQPCADPNLEGLLVPAVGAVQSDDDNERDCWSDDEERLKVCTVGPTTGYEQYILAVGDSHNNTLLGAYRLIAEERNWRIDVAGRAGCHWTARTPTSLAPQAKVRCEAWIHEVDGLVAKRSPQLDAILVTHSAKMPVEQAPGESAREARIAGLVEAWARRSDFSVPVIAIRDNPAFEPDQFAYARDVLPCIDEYRATADAACSRERSHVLLDDGHAAAVIRDPSAHLVDLTSFYCVGAVCPPVIGNVVVYRDGSHLTATYARSLAPYLGGKLAKILDGNELE